VKIAAVEKSKIAPDEFAVMKDAGAMLP